SSVKACIASAASSRRRAAAWLMSAMRWDARSSTRRAARKSKPTSSAPTRSGPIIGVETSTTMSAAEPPQGANSAPAGGSAAAKPQAWGDHTSAPELALRQLQTLGADAFAHINGSLAVHLRGTEALLRRWGNRDAVCLGGLYHAVYGTDRITGSLADLGMRGAIAEVIGAEAESLAYLYGACARETFHPRIGTHDQLMFADRFAHCEYPIAASQLRD